MHFWQNQPTQNQLKWCKLVIFWDQPVETVIRSSVIRRSITWYSVNGEGKTKGFQFLNFANINMETFLHFCIDRIDLQNTRSASSHKTNFVVRRHKRETTIVYTSFRTSDERLIKPKGYTSKKK